MKIAFVSTNDSAPWGGSEELWSQTAMRMANRGFKVVANVKGWNPEARQISELEQSNCQVIRRWYPTNFPARVLQKIPLFSTYKRPNFLAQFDPDLVVISQGFNCEGLDWMEACSHHNIPFAVIVQAGSDESGWSEDRTVERLAKAHMSAKKVFFVSRMNLQSLTKQIGVNLPNFKIIANPFNVPYDIQIPWVENVETLKLACVARLDPAAKGQDILLEVLTDEKWKQRSVEISFFGDGINRQLLEKLTNLWQIKQVKFRGHVSHIPDIWSEHHALILPSRFEGLPIALVEAMLCARTCIVTDVAGDAEFVKDNITGFIAKAPKAEFVDEALERAWQNRDNLRSMGEAASASIRQIIPADPIETFADEISFLL